MKIIINVLPTLLDLLSSLFWDTYDHLPVIRAWMEQIFG